MNGFAWLLHQVSLSGRVGIARAAWPHYLFGLVFGLSLFAGPVWAEEGGWILSRADTCEPSQGGPPHMALSRCQREERVRVPQGGGVWRALPRRAQEVTLPTWMTGFYRLCSDREIPELEADAARFLSYRDAFVGRCYLYAPLDEAALAALSYDRKAFLDGVHPYVAAVTRRAIVAAAKAGYPFRVISGLRPKQHTSWHGFGLAVDVYYGPYEGLKKATQAYRRDPKVAEAYRTFAAEAERLGMTWLGHRQLNEIFHIEWHPGWPGRPPRSIRGKAGRVFSP